MALDVDGHNRIYYSQMLTPEIGGGEEFKLVQNRMALFQDGRARTGEDPFGRVPQWHDVEEISEEYGHEPYLRANPT